MSMVRNLAKRAMTTRSQKACYVIDNLVVALGDQPSSSVRRALILIDIDQYPGTTQTGVMERMNVDRSTMNREIEWLFNYGCIRRRDSKNDGREVQLETCGYSKSALEEALGYFDGGHDLLKMFLERMTIFLKQEKPTLRDAKIVSTLYEKKDAPKQQVIDSLYGGSASTDNRAFNKLVDEGVITDA